MFKSIIKPALFCYAIPATNVGAGAVITPQINISNDADFMLVEVRATKQAAGGILAQLSLASGDLFSNVPLDTRLFAEDDYPVRLPEPVRIPANSQINVQLQNTTGGALSSQIQLWGYKVECSKSY
ncbi:MAG: hypothetical protein IPM51_12190 [Sphingobacteriaceae bacterium]|nr:hypothetical protein [Sphingobacteriaceae bacterium]